MKVIIADIHRASDLAFVAELLLQTARRAGASFDHAHRQASFFLAAEAGKKLIDDMNDFNHGNRLLNIEKSSKRSSSSTVLNGPQRLNDWKLLVFRASKFPLPPNIRPAHHDITRLQ